MRFQVVFGLNSHILLFLCSEEKILDEVQLENPSHPFHQKILSPIVMLKCFSYDDQVGISAEHVEKFIFTLIFSEGSFLFNFRLVGESIGDLAPEPFPVVDVKFITKLSF